MRFRKLVFASFVFGAAVLAAKAQQGNEVEQLKQQLRQVLQVQEEQRQKIETLMKQLEEVAKKQTVDAEKKKLEEQLAKDLNQPSPPAQPATITPSSAWSPAQPMTIARAGSAYMNISFDTLMDVGSSTVRDPSAQLQLGDHDPVKRGFSLRNAEIAVDGAVDPYFKGFGNIVFKLDKNNGTETELEEAGFFHPPEKKPSMVQNLRSALARARFSDQEVRTFRGVVTALSRGRGRVLEKIAKRKAPPVPDEGGGRAASEP